MSTSLCGAFKGTTACRYVGVCISAFQSAYLGHFPQGAIGACDNPGLGAAGFLYASSLKAAGREADNVRPVLCFLVRIYLRGYT